MKPLTTALAPLFLSVLLGLGACAPATPATHDAAVPKVAVTAHETKVNGEYTWLLTVPHDGHQFVVARAIEAVSVIHHPSCPCLSPSPNAKAAP